MSTKKLGLEADSDERKNLYSNAVLRLMYLFRCFYNDEVAKILKIKPERLYKDTSFVNRFFDGKYALHYGGDSLPVKAASDEDYVSVNPLWHVYDDPVKTHNLLKCSRQYADIMYWIKSYFDKEEYDNSEKNCLEYALEKVSFTEQDKELSRVRSEAKKGKRKNADKQKSSSDEATGEEPQNSKNEVTAAEAQDSKDEVTGKKLETTGNNRFSELKELGAITDEGDYYTESPIDTALDELLKDGSVDYTAFYNLLCYSMHFLHPSIYGYNLLKLVETDAKEDEVDIGEIPIRYSGFQAQSILSAEKCIDIIECIERKRPLKFDYIKNEESVIEYESNRYKKIKKEVIPYRLVYDLRFGRYYMIAFNPEAVSEGRNAMERFQVDYMEKLSIPRKTVKTIYNSIQKYIGEEADKKKSGSGEQYIMDLMEGQYHRYFEGAWISRGTPTEDGRYYRITFMRRLQEEILPEIKDYEGYFSCDYQGYNEEDHTYYIIIPDYLDIKVWVLEHMVPDNNGWFEIVKEEQVVRDGSGWKTVSKDSEHSLVGNIEATLESMENYYAVQ